MVDEDLTRSDDPLENLSYLRGKCLICGREIHERVRGERVSAFLLCDCGNIVNGINQERWH